MKAYAYWNKYETAVVKGSVTVYPGDLRGAPGAWKNAIKEAIRQKIDPDRNFEISLTHVSGLGPIDEKFQVVTAEFVAVMHRSEHANEENLDLDKAIETTSKAAAAFQPDNDDLRWEKAAN